MRVGSVCRDGYWYDVRFLLEGDSELIVAAIWSGSSSVEVTFFLG